MEKGQKCYLKAIATEYNGNDFAQVALLVHDTPHEYKSAQTKDSIHEKQRLIVRTEFFHEVHAIHITEYNGGDGTLTLTWDAYQSDPIALPSTTEEVRRAVLALFTGMCSDPERDVQFGDVRIAYGFESGSGGRTSEGSNRAAPQQTIGDAYCGRGSLLVVSGNAAVVVDEEGYDVFNYDSICMAYKIPSGTHSTLFFDVQDDVQDLGRWLVLLTHDPSAGPYPVLGDIGDRPLIANNTMGF
ncbi:fibrocystin-like [Oscarella lobularis]|uniref:fibrocystin-like n=1 Tax=Oscarella lobularis TaxID=121494 RepID=UPI003313637F